MRDGLGHTELVGRKYVQSAFPLWQKSVLVESLCSGAVDLQESCGFIGLCSSQLLTEIQTSHILPYVAANNVSFYHTRHMFFFFFYLSFYFLALKAFG